MTNKNSFVCIYPEYDSNQNIVSYKIRLDNIGYHDQNDEIIEFYVPEKFIKYNDIYYHNNSAFVMERFELLSNLAWKINKLAHISLVPYTAYFPYAYKSYKNDKSLEKNIFNFFNRTDIYSLEMCSDICDVSELKTKMYPVGYCANTGYFSGMRFFINDKTKEFLFFPIVMLPTMTATKLKALYLALFHDVKLYSDINWDDGLRDGFRDRVTDSEPNYDGRYYKFKNLYEPKLPNI